MARQSDEFKDAPGISDVQKNQEDAKKTFAAFLKQAKEYDLTLEEMIGKWIIIDKLVGQTGKTARTDFDAMNEIVTEVMRGYDNISSKAGSIGKSTVDLKGEFKNIMNLLSSGGAKDVIDQYYGEMSSAGELTKYFLVQMQEAAQGSEDLGNAFSSSMSEGLKSITDVMQAVGKVRGQFTDLFDMGMMANVRNMMGEISDSIKAITFPIEQLSGKTVSLTGVVQKLKSNVGSATIEIDGKAQKYDKVFGNAKKQIDATADSIGKLQDKLKEAGTSAFDDVQKKVKNLKPKQRESSIIGQPPKVDQGDAKRIKELNKLIAEMQGNFTTAFEGFSLGEEVDDEVLNKLQSQLHAITNLDPEIGKELTKDLAAAKGQGQALKLQMESLEDASGHLQNLETTRGLFIQIRGAAENVRNSIISTLGVLPGWMQNLIGVSKISNTLTEGINDGMKRGMKAFNEEIKNTGDFFKAARAAVGKLKGSIRAAMMALGPIAIAVAAIGAILAVTILLGNRIEGISQDLGISKQQALELHKGMMLTNDASKASLLTMEDMVEVQKAHIALTGRLLDLQSEVNREQVQFASNMANAYGTGIQDVYNMMHEFQELGADPTLSQQLTQWVGRAAELSGISFDTIAKDLAESAEFVAMHFSGMPKDAAKAVVEVRKMGSSLKQVAQIYDNMVNVDSFMGDMHELAAMSGADLSVAFNMRMTGEEPHKVMEEIWKEYDNLSDSMKENEFVNKKFADTLGMSVDEMKASEKIRRFSKNLSEEELKLVQAHAGALSDQDLANQQNLKAKAEELATQKQMTAQFDRIKGQFAQALLPLAQLFADVFSALMPVFDLIGVALKIIGLAIKPFIPIFKLLGFLVDSISTVLSGIINMISSIVDGASNWLDETFGLNEVIGGVSNWFDNIKYSLKIIVGSLITAVAIAMNWQKIMSGFNLMKNFNLKSFMSIGKKGGKNLLSGMKSVWNKGKDAIFGKKTKFGVDTMMGKGGSGKRTSGLLGKAKNMFKKKDGEKVTKPMSSMKDKIGGMFNKNEGKKAGGGISNFFKSIMDAIKKIKMKDVLKAAAALLVLSAALWVTGKAVKQFVGVNWEDLAKAGASLAGLAATALVIGKIKGEIIKGAAALAIMGAALVPLAYALSLMEDVKWPALAMLGVALVGLTAAVIGLGAIMMSGVGAAAMTLGAIALAGLGAALIPLAAALRMAGPAMGHFAKVIESFGKAVRSTLQGLGSIIESVGVAIATVIRSISDGFATIFDSITATSPMELMGIALGLTAVSGALATFGAGSALAGLGSFFGGNPLSDLVELSKQAPQMERFANSVMRLAEALNRIASVNANSDLTSNVESTHESLAKSVNLTSEIDQTLQGGTIQGTSVKQPSTEIQEVGDTYKSQKTEKTVVKEVSGSQNNKNIEMLLKKLIRTVEQSSLKEIPLVIGSKSGRELNSYLKKFN